MDHIDHVADYSLKIIKEGLFHYWESLSKEEMHKQFLHIGEISHAKWQISFMGAQIAAYVYNLKELCYDLKEILPAEYLRIYDHFMSIIPDAIQTTALISKYINEGLPAELILSLVQKKDEGKP